MDISSALAKAFASQYGATAVRDTAGQLSYGELNNWSNAIGRQVIETAGAESQVCLVVARFNCNSIAAMTGVLKTPHIFVALDSEMPPENLARVAADLDAGIILFAPEAEETVHSAGLTIPAIRLATPPGRTSGAADLA